MVRAQEVGLGVYFFENFAPKCSTRVSPVDQKKSPLAFSKGGKEGESNYFETCKSILFQLIRLALKRSYFVRV